MEAKQESKVSLDLSRNEAVLLLNALGGVCDGPYAVEDWEFHTLLGATKDEAEQLLKRLSSVIEGA